MRGPLACLLLVAGLLVTTGFTDVKPTSAAAGGRTHTIVIENMAFSPATVRIRTGDQVLFVNKDLVAHTATAKPESVFNSGLIQPGESWSVRPSGTDAIRYACILHPMMEGRIVIDPASSEK